MSTENSLNLPEEISIANITEWKSKLVDYSAEPSPLVLNAEHLSRVDTAGIQLMLAFVTKAKAESKTISWHQPSQVLLKTAKQLGLDGALQLT